MGVEIDTIVNCSALERPPQCRQRNTCSYLRPPYPIPHTFGFARPYPRPALQPPKLFSPMLLQLLSIGCTQAQLCNHSSPIGAMRGAHVEPVRGGTTLLSRCLLVASGGALIAAAHDPSIQPSSGPAGRPGDLGPEGHFSSPNFTRSPCAGGSASLIPNAAAHQHSSHCAH